MAECCYCSSIVVHRPTALALLHIHTACHWLHPDADDGGCQDETSPPKRVVRGGICDASLPCLSSSFKLAFHDADTDTDTDTDILARIVAKDLREEIARIGRKDV